MLFNFVEDDLCGWGDFLKFVEDLVFEIDVERYGDDGDKDANRYFKFVEIEIVVGDDVC